MMDGSMKSLTNWFQQQAEKEAKKDVLKKSDRWGNLVGIVVIIIILMFFIVHSTSKTGFFTGAFGATEAALFFGVAAWGMISPIVRFVTGRKSLSKSLDIIGSILCLIAIIYFLASFPFDFSHISDPLPNVLKWVLQWITDDFARALMVIGTIVLIFVIPFQSVSYLYLRRKLSKTAGAPSETADPIQDEETPKQ